MPRHSGLPRPMRLVISKRDLLKQLSAIDADNDARQRVLAMETEFRSRIAAHVEALSALDARFAKFYTSPFVVLIHSLKQGYRHINQIEADLLPAKLFSSMETSAGRMVETVVLPVYGWQVVPSAMHTPNSALDGKCLKDKVLCLATLKSGPRCLNDGMCENLADAILVNCEAWAADANVRQIEFSYGGLYGTPHQSNKKDWHILRNIKEKLPQMGGTLLVAPDDQWGCEFEKNGIRVSVTIRIGIDLWNYFGAGTLAFMEMSAALIRACISPSDTQPDDYSFVISDLPEIISLEAVPEGYNVSLLQRSQLEWLFFFARHFCDQLVV